MSDTESITYDPTDAQLRDVKMLLGAEELSLADVVKRPEAVQLLLRQQQSSLLDLRAVKSDLVDAQRTSAKLQADRESLRIELAVLKERLGGTLIEIPISIATGFAINILTSNVQNAPGWLLLLLSLAVLSYLRRHQIGSLLRGRVPPKE